MKSPQNPLESSLKIVECISNIGNLYISNRQKLEFRQELGGERKEFVFAITKGRLGFYRKNVFIGDIDAPCCVGLLRLEVFIDIYHLIPSGDSIVFAAERSAVIEALTKEHLWGDILNYQSYVSDFIIYRREMIIKNSAYSVICNLLKELAKRPMEEREKISVGNYILENSDMARSGMMRILSDLKIGGYIEMKKGKLIQICKTLPEKY